MNMMHSTVLHSQVINSTSSAVKGSTGGSGVIENKHTREHDREEMWFFFILGMFLGIGYLFFFPGSEIKDSFLEGLWDGSYLMFCFLCHMAVAEVSWNDKQPKRAIKTSLVMSATLAVVMLVPFIMDMDTQIHFREFWGGFGVNDDMHYFYREYTNYTNLIQIGIMVIWCLYRTIKPLYRLYQMRNKL